VSLIVFLARKDAKAQRKNSWRLGESPFFFSRKDEEPSYFREAMREFFVVWRAKSQSRKENPFASWRLCALTSFFSHREGAYDK
jgi:hypothetical protein